ncbi:sugar phosphate isomerase/epimerase family protein [Victivallis vadensis]|uniref:sugar phosphate isomerase/epimerase family protein n=1 Tax=Victivallis vadensis TaxID=172901 RepID=UPI00307EE93F
MEELAIGLMIRFAVPPEESFRRLRGFGLRHCQLTAPPDHYLYGDEGRENTRKLKEAAARNDVVFTSLFISFPDQDWKDWRNGIGLVPAHTRTLRFIRACRSADWARELGVTQLTSHVGAVPEDPASPLYQSFVTDMRAYLKLLEANGQTLAYETGQESVATLKRLMDDLGAANQGVNFDPANLLIYNEDDPSVLLRELGDRILHVHCKDGVRPEAGKELGRETRLGEGDTRFSELLRELIARGYRGPLTIEREIAAGPELDRDVANAIISLNQWKQEFAI